MTVKTEFELEEGLVQELEKYFEEKCIDPEAWFKKTLRMGIIHTLNQRNRARTPCKRG